MNDSAGSGTLLDEPTDLDEVPDEQVGEADADGPGADLPVPVDSPDHSGQSTMAWVSWGVVAACVVTVFIAMQPRLLFTNSTPTGGDMGAHVWGPRYLMDHLIPQLRLSGWSPDWYAGFPAYTFYMVVPSLFIVLLAAGPPWWLTPFLLAALGFGTYQAQERITSPARRTLLLAAAGLVAVLCVPVPYNVSFKLVSVAGLCAMPLAAFALARAAKLPFPGPPLIAVASLVFLFDNGYTILGGNIASTMAGEFAFSISLMFALLYLAVLVKGSRTGTDRALGAFLFALVTLCHLIPAIFAAVATVVYLLTRREDREPWWDRNRNGRLAAGGVVAVVLLSLWLAPSAFPLVATVAAVALFVSFDARVLKWSAVVLPVGGLLSGFWFVPFYLNSPYLNDMGWEKYTDYAKHLWPDPAVNNMPYRNVVFALAALGIVLSLVHRVRLGWYLSLMMLVLAWTFRYLPQYRLWNARLLPFYFLCVTLLAGLAVALVLRSLAVVVQDVRQRREEPVLVGAVGAVVTFAVVLVAILGPLRFLPGGTSVADPAKPGGQMYSWMGLDFRGTNFVSDWARWNYSGLEGKPAWPEYKGIVDTMTQVGKDQGCGRAMWEYEPDLNRFGTPMALMLLPYFTKSCIGSMEGLYFEASSTTPFHFLNQSELSAQPSRAQRDMPYSDFNIEQGISHLQLLGVKYYMAVSDKAKAAAASDPRLTEVASTGKWKVYEIADAQQVVGLKYDPVVLNDTDDHIDGWVYDKERPEPAEGQVVAQKTPGPAVDWYNDPTRWEVPLATSGPASWPRAQPSDTAPPKKSVTQAKVSDVVTTDRSISFKVDRTGSPVLVKTSYFPNWKVSGASGPYRVSPNQMVVVPTSKVVTLTYGRSAIDLLGIFLTLVGMALLALLVRSDSRRSLALAHEAATVPTLETLPTLATVPTLGESGEPVDPDPTDGAADDDPTGDPVDEAQDEPEPEQEPEPDLDEPEFDDVDAGATGADDADGPDSGDTESDPDPE